MIMTSGLVGQSRTLDKELHKTWRSHQLLAAVERKNSYTISVREYRNIRMG